MIRATDVSVYYENTRIVSEASFEVPAGKTLAVVGPSGSGKTTLLYALSGLVDRVFGDVEVETDGRRRLGLVMQNYGLFPWFTTVENVMVGLKIEDREYRKGRRFEHFLSPEVFSRWPSREENLKKARYWLDRLGIADKENEFIGKLSGGEQQRVALARTLVLSPGALLLDEPFSALDALTREELQEDLVPLLRTHRISALFVTHSIEEAVFVGDQVGILSGRPAKLRIRQNAVLPREHRRIHPGYLKACAEFRSWFEEVVRA